ncbi:MAG: peptidoglycan DD-metalloendopeptidase family protein [Chitinophagales bacterium]|nr:peptidoglycan DD-metalloendopeptidase family protein [Chitinophagales bacterium]
MALGKITTTLFALAGAAAILYFSYSAKNTLSFNEQLPPPESQATIVAAPVNMQFGLIADDYDVARHKIKSGQYFGDILGSQGLDQRYLHNLSVKYKEVFDVKRLKAGRHYNLFSSKDSGKPFYFVYELDDVDYVVYDFTRDSVYMESKEVTFERKTASGTIQSSLYQSFADNNIDPQVGMELADIFGWVVDFYRLQKGDNFKVIYEQRLVEGKPAGVNRVFDAVFNHAGNDFYAFYYNPDADTYGEYFDENAHSLRKAFLKAPLKFSRISSKYSKNRLHPVLKTYRPHLGVDYAAPTGTPILSVGEGIVTESQYSKNNGNYVKVRHNSTYSTQYLHMSKFATGMKPGTKVSQGQVIGYVGSTGLATGPHVCFRFWKNGVQVDPLKVAIPPSEPVSSKYIEDYNRRVARAKDELGKI